MTRELAAAIADLEDALERTDNFVGAMRAVLTVAVRHPFSHAATADAFRHAAERRIQEMARGLDTDKAMKAAVWATLDAAQSVR